mmetsp:Transcript_3951/g.13730  ORF Transcript_3951/g.13730 Transcript_3951/m.13730 type:complete len:288 (+) Transcript_3951:1045-1908(+)
MLLSEPREKKPAWAQLTQGLCTFLCVLVVRGPSNNGSARRTRLLTQISACRYPCPVSTCSLGLKEITLVSLTVVAHTFSFVQERPGPSRRSLRHLTRRQLTISASVSRSQETKRSSVLGGMTTRDLKAGARTFFLVLGRPGHNSKNSRHRTRPQAMYSASQCQFPAIMLSLDPPVGQKPHMCSAALHATRQFPLQTAMSARVHPRSRVARRLHRRATPVTLYPGRARAVLARSRRRHVMLIHATRLRPPRMAPSATARAPWRVGLRASRRATQGTRSLGRARALLEL